ncbi:hypothetical protein AAU61_01650 [Desulfocarbo indianensis]|nr:hypothetical protein AAU61_01650 [Desulfocarbo indianensis]
MRKARALLMVLIFLSLCGMATLCRAQDLKASLPILPPLVETPQKGILVNLVKAIDQVYPGGSISIEVAPFSRSIRNVVSGQADFHMPLLKNPLIPENKLDFMYSTETIFSVVFVLYSKKDLDMANLKQYNLETDRAHVDYFEFPIKPSDSIEGSLRKVSRGRIDGFIFAMVESDAALQKLGLKDIKRKPYKTFDVKIVLQKNANGKKADAILSKAIEDLRKSGKYQQIMGPIVDQKFK